MRLLKKFLVVLTATSMFGSIFVTSAFAASESGDALSIKANLYDYGDKDNDKFNGNDSDKILFNGDTSNKNPQKNKNHKSDYDDKNSWDGSPDVWSDEYNKTQHYKIIENLVKDELENGELKTNFDVYSNGEKVDLFTGDSQDYVLVFEKNEDGVYSHKEGLANKDDKFLPLGKNNFFFGMSFAFDFILGEDRTGMKFNFIGDDDVWVYIGGKLVLDLGGIHSKVGGTIDFENNKVLRTGQFKDNNYSVVETREKEYYLEDGKHTLVFYYLERGASNSRCGIEFKLNDVTPTDIKPSEIPETSEEPSESGDAPSATPSSKPYVPYYPTTETPSEEPKASEEPSVKPNELPQEEVTTEPTEEPTKEVIEEKENPTQNLATAVEKEKVNKKNKKNEQQQEEIDKNTPQTGDSSMVNSAIIIMVVSLVITIGLLVHTLGRKEK